jgi:hypothetical protein
MASAARHSRSQGDLLHSSLAEGTPVHGHAQQQCVPKKTRQDAAATRAANAYQEGQFGVD